MWRLRHRSSAVTGLAGTVTLYWFHDYCDGVEGDGDQLPYINKLLTTILSGQDEFGNKECLCIGKQGNQGNWTSVEDSEGTRESSMDAMQEK
jgi:hypothetical protein